MASRPLITLFDIPSITRKSWSPNVWKARLVLNYKALPYTTEWLDFSNLSTYMQPHVKPNEPPLSPHTIPCILLQEGETTRGIMGSRSIAEELEKHFSTPSLQFDSEESARVEELAEKLLISSRPLWAHLLPKKVLVPSDRQYYADTRAKRFGMSLDSYYRPFLMNYHPSYADFTVVALLRFFSCVDQTMSDHFYSAEPQLLKLYEACHQWLERDY
ncbi:hypothetical protein ACKLNR_004924 [Fusarium oxysporum f. sp. zingiberi]